jgi:hypothetical protein
VIFTGKSRLAALDAVKVNDPSVEFITAVSSTSIIFFKEILSVYETISSGN